MSRAQLNQIDSVAITVGPPGRGADYETIKDALAAAVAYTTILVYPNTSYPEDNPLQMKEHVSIFYIGLHEVGFVDCQNPNEHGIVMASDSEIHGLQVRNASGAGSAGFHAPDGVSDVELHDTKVRDCDIGWLSEVTGVNALVAVRDPHISGGTSTDAFKCASGGYMKVNGFTTTNDATLANVFHSDGAGSYLVAYGSLVRGNNTTRASLTENGGVCEFQVYHADGCTEGHVVEATGGTLTMGSCQLTSVAGDHIRLGDDPSCVCIVNGCYLDDSKFNLGSSAMFDGFYESADPLRFGTTAIGELWLGVNVDEQVPLATYTRQTATTGWVEGGALSLPGGLDVDVAEGAGIVNTGTGVVVIEWSSDTLTMPANQDFWVFTDETEVIQSSITKPNLETKVLLGVGRANATEICLLARQVVDVAHPPEHFHEWVFENVGMLWRSGLAVTDHAAPSLTLEVDSGVYFTFDERTVATGSSPAAATWCTWYRDGSGDWVHTMGVGTLDNANYDDGSGVLQAIPGGNWVKPQLWVAVTDGTTAFHLVYPQTTHGTQLAAEGAAPPTPPTIFGDSALPIAGPVFQQGGNIASIVDDRPALQTGGAGGAAAAAVHSALAGLAADDHSQYALLSGNAGRNAITGTFDFGAGGLLLPLSAAPAQTADGEIVWDSILKLVTVGDGTGRRVLVSTVATQTLLNKTLTSPTIGDFSNAGHGHQNASGGGVLAAPGITSFANALHNHSNAAGGGLVAQATEALRGGAEVATQAEVDAGAIDTAMVTPLKLATLAVIANPRAESRVIDTDTLDVISGLTPTVISGMTTTPPAGTWNVYFEGEIQANGTMVSGTQFYLDGTPVGTARSRSFINNQYGSVSHHARITTTGVEVLDLRATTSASSMDVNGRTLTLIRVDNV